MPRNSLTHPCRPGLLIPVFPNVVEAVKEKAAGSNSGSNETLMWISRDLREKLGGRSHTKEIK
jgi:hypothetical protein